MNKRILVKTDDPANKKLFLTITGKVNSVVHIKPAVVSLSGMPGQTLESTVTITPAENYDMKILGLTQKFKNNNIKAQLLPPEQGSREWRVKIESFSDKADDFYDILTLKTDSKLKPKLRVRVYAIYLDKKGRKS